MQYEANVMLVVDVLAPNYRKLIGCDSGTTYLTMPAKAIYMGFFHPAFC